MSIEEAAAPYSSSVVYLFLGGFVLGARHPALRARPAHRVPHPAARRYDAGPAGGRDARDLRVPSMWISNTAAAAMMVPIAIAVVDLVVRTGTGAALRPEAGHPRGARRRAQFRHRARAGDRLRRVDRRRRHADRLAAERHRCTLHPADLRRRGDVPLLARDRAAADARDAPRGLVHPRPRRVPEPTRSGGGWAQFPGCRASQARAALARRGRGPRGVRGDGLPLDHAALGGRDQVRRHAALRRAHRRRSRR